MAEPIRKSTTFTEAELSEFERHELIRKAREAGLPWHQARGAVVSDHTSAGGRSPEWSHYYGGVLVAESITGTPLEYLVGAANAVPALVREVDRLQGATGELRALQDRIRDEIDWQETKATKHLNHSGSDDIAHQAAMAKAVQVRQETAMRLRNVLHPIDNEEEPVDVPF